RDRNVTGVQTCALPIYRPVDAQEVEGAEGADLVHASRKTPAAEHQGGPGTAIASPLLLLARGSLRAWRTLGRRLEFDDVAHRNRSEERRVGKGGGARRP